MVAGVAVLCGGSEHSLDSMCLTKAAELVIDWWLSNFVEATGSPLLGEITAEVSGALFNNCCLSIMDSVEQRSELFMCFYRHSKMQLWVMNPLRTPEEF